MKRISFFDNAKFFLIFLVVFGHMIQPYIYDVKEIGTLYYFIYFFHMPAFVLLSGFFAKGIWKKQYIQNLVKKLLLPYVIFQVFYTVYYVLIGMSDWQFSLMTPKWSLWYLISLFCWHILLIVFKNFGPSGSIFLAVITGLSVGYIDSIGHTLSLSRTFVFFPFFLAGYWMKYEHFRKLKKKMSKIVSIIVSGAVVFVLYFTPNFSVDWLLGSTSYHSLGASFTGGIIRLGIYLVSFILVLCFFVFVPEKKTTITSIGQHTMYVYLLHGVFIHYFRVKNFFHVNTFTDGLILALFSFMIIDILTSKHVRMFTQPLIQLRWSRWKKQVGKVKKRGETFTTKMGA